MCFHWLRGVFVIGALIQIRTGDLILTKDALYRLSYSSVATRIRLELTTSSVTGWRSNQLNYGSVEEISLGNFIDLVGTKGLEPLTSSL